MYYAASKKKRKNHRIPTTMKVEQVQEAPDYVVLNIDLTNY